VEGSLQRDSPGHVNPPFRLLPEVREYCLERRSGLFYGNIAWELSLAADSGHPECEFLDLHRGTKDVNAPAIPVNVSVKTSCPFDCKELRTRFQHQLPCHAP